MVIGEVCEVDPLRYAQPRCGEAVEPSGRVHNQPFAVGALVRCFEYGVTRSVYNLNFCGDGVNSADFGCLPGRQCAPSHLGKDRDHNCDCRRTATFPAAIKRSPSGPRSSAPIKTSSSSESLYSPSVISCSVWLIIVV